MNGRLMRRRIRPMTHPRWMTPARRRPKLNRPRMIATQTRPRWMKCASPARSEEHTSELQSLMRISYAVFCLKKKNIPIKDERHQDRLCGIENPTDKSVDEGYH